jgi:hypothetical protein
MVLYIETLVYYPTRSLSSKLGEPSLSVQARISKTCSHEFGQANSAPEHAFTPCTRLHILVTIRKPRETSQVGPLYALVWRLRLQDLHLYDDIVVPNMGPPTALRVSLKVSENEPHHK